MSKRLIGIVVLSFFCGQNAVFGGFWEDVKKVASVAANPVGAAVGAAAEKVAPVVGIDPKAAETIVNPTGAIVQHAPEIVKSPVQTEIRYWAQLVDAVKEGRPDKAFVNELQAGLNRSLNEGVVKTVQPALAALALPPGLGSTMMEAPRVTVINPAAFPGEVVYYVNGMATSREMATDEATALSRQLHRPVGLIYNETHEPVADLLECAYDRLWPLVPIIPGSVNVQANPTTRQVAHLFFHAKRPISIVSQSQGCIIVRNALLIANSYGGGEVKGRVAWVATGMPLRREEIYPQPARFRVISNADDLVCQSVGLELKPDKFLNQNGGLAHDFRRAYVGQIRPEDLF